MHARQWELRAWAQRRWWGGCVRLRHRSLQRQPREHSRASAMRRYRATGGADSVARTQTGWCGTSGSIRSSACACAITLHTLERLCLCDQPQQVRPPLVCRDLFLPDRPTADSPGGREAWQCMASTCANSMSRELVFYFFVFL